MTQLLSLSRSARLASVTRAAIQRRIGPAWLSPGGRWLDRGACVAGSEDRRRWVWLCPPIDLGPDWDALVQPSPEYVFNQEVQW